MAENMQTNIQAQQPETTPVAAETPREEGRGRRDGNRDGGRGGRDGNRDGGRGRREGGREREDKGDMVDKLIAINRVSKTVKGGRTMRMAAIVVVGDEAGRVGWGKGKSREVPEAVRKATEEAKRAMVRVQLRQGRTLHHEVTGSFGATNVVLRPAVPGTGIIAGGPMRAIFEAMGIKDVVAKALGSTNPYNLIQATFNAFHRIETPRSIAAKRGLKLTDLVLHRDQASKGEVDQKELLEKAEKAKAARAAREEAQSKNAPAGRGGRDGARGGRPGGRDGGRDAGRGAPRGDNRGQGGRSAAPKVVTVSKSDSMKQAVSTEAPASEENNG